MNLQGKAEIWATLYDQAITKASKEVKGGLGKNLNVMLGAITGNLDEFGLPNVGGSKSFGPNDTSETIRDLILAKAAAGNQVIILTHANIPENIAKDIKPRISGHHGYLYELYEPNAVEGELIVLDNPHGEGYDPIRNRSDDDAKVKIENLKTVVSSIIWIPNAGN